MTIEKEKIDAALSRLAEQFPRAGKAHATPAAKSRDRRRHPGRVTGSRSAFIVTFRARRRKIAPALTDQRETSEPGSGDAGSLGREHAPPVGLREVVGLVPKRVAKAISLLVHQRGSSLAGAATYTVKRLRRRLPRYCIQHVPQRLRPRAGHGGRRIQPAVH